MERFITRQPKKEDEKIAREVANWTARSGTMLPKTEEEVRKLFNNGDSVLIVDQDNIPSGHAAITYQYGESAVEVGAVVVNESYRRKGVGTLAAKGAVKLAQEKHPGKTIFALVNELSEKLFRNIGGEDMNTNELPNEVWEPCKICPRYPEQIPGQSPKCCDKPVNLTKVK